MTKTIREVLQETRDYLSDPSHWVKGIESDSKKPRRCLVDAIYSFADTWDKDGWPRFMTCCQRFREINNLETTSKIKNESIAKWNDAPGLTHAEMLAALDKTIEQIGR
jgi:hypothetical protein